MELSSERIDNVILVKIFEPKFTNLQIASFREQIESKFSESQQFIFDLTAVNYLIAPELAQ